MRRKKSLPQGILIVNPDQLKIKCEHVLRQTLGKHIGFSSLTQTMRYRKVLMLGASEGASKARTKKYPYTQYLRQK